MASAREVYTESVARGVSGLPIAPPTLSGAPFVIDCRMQRSITGRGLRDQFTQAFDVDVLGLRRLSRGDLQQATAPQRREQLAVESEQARADSRLNLRGLAEKSLNTIKLVRGLAVVLIVGAGLFAAWPFLTSGGAALKSLKFLQRGRGA